MSVVDLFLTYLSKSSTITIIVLGWLSLYFILSFTILISRWFALSAWERREKLSLDSMLMGAKNVRNDSTLRQCSSTTSFNLDLLLVCEKIAQKNATIGLAWLSIIASTSPFIGLFGTVVSILETFSGLGQNSSASLGVIAPAISEALVATAGGIFVAIPAYTFHSILKRKGYEVVNVISRQIDILKSNSNKKAPETNDDKLG